MPAYTEVGDGMRYSDLCGKQVVNVENGKVIGYINDLRFLEKDYVIKEFYVSPPSSCIKKLFHWFFPKVEVKVRTCDIVNIGQDVILVQLS